MKKRKFIFLAIIALMLLAAFAWADESEYYVKTVPISKVYTHNLGYKILYVKSDMSLGAFYVPFAWFVAPAAKGDLIWGITREYPFFSIFYKNGEFSHIRLYLKKNKDDVTWGGTLKNIPEVREKFNIESLELEF